MQPDNILRQTYSNLVERAVGITDTALADREHEAIATAARFWTLATGALADVDASIAQFGEGIFQIQANADLTDEAKRNRAAELTEATRAVVQIHSATVLTNVDKVLTGLHAASYPARPLPHDAAQEGRIAGIKADLTMTLGATDDGFDTVKRMEALLDRAVGDEDKLATWVLASSRWPEDYLTSRRFDDHVDAWRSRVASMLDQGSDPDTASVRVSYNAVSNGSKGLPALKVAATTLLPQIITEIGSWALASDRMYR